MKRSKQAKKKSIARNPSKNTIKRLHRGDQKFLPGRSHIKTNYFFYNWIGARAYIISKGKVNNINNEGFETYLPKGNKYTLVSFIYETDSGKQKLTFRSKNIMQDFIRFDIPIKETTTIIIHKHRGQDKKIELSFENIMTFGAMLVLAFSGILLLAEALELKSNLKDQ